MILHWLIRIGVSITAGLTLAASCSDKPCTQTCRNGEAICAASGTERKFCVYDPTTGCQVWTILPCTTGQICEPQTARCIQQNGVPEACKHTCTQGQRQCLSSSMLTQCEQNKATGCWNWSAAQACPQGMSCLSDHCSPNGCLSECKSGELRCWGTQIQSCVVQNNTCWKWGGVVSCPTGQTCNQGQCVPSSGTPCPPSCQSDRDCQIQSCGIRTSCVQGTCQQPSQPQNCPATCVADIDCQKPECQGRTACHQGTCVTPGSFCPSVCQNHSQCQITPCGTRRSCTQGTCQVEQTTCPASCTQHTECQVTACGTKRECLGQTCSEPFVLTAAEKDLLDAINRARQQNNLSVVQIDPKLTCAARKHANDVGKTRTCGHVGTDGSWPWDRAQACGFPQTKWTVNEIAAGPGFRDGDDAVSGWRQSPGHWDALIHNQAKWVGVGVYNSCYIALFDCCVKGSD